MRLLQWERVAKCTVVVPDTVLLDYCDRSMGVLGMEVASSAVADAPFAVADVPSAIADVPSTVADAPSVSQYSLKI